jgi:hypothetical protein
MPDRPFRSCGSCQQAWRDWRELVLDPALRLLGLQIAPGRPEGNLLVFEHDCRSSVSVLASRLRPHLGGDDEATSLPSLFESEACSGRCRFLENLEACDRPCANARDRRLALAVLEARRSRATPEPRHP